MPSAAERSPALPPHTAPTRSPTPERTPDAAGLAASYAYCADLVRRRARNFYFGLRMTPEPRRSALYAVYAWMREADDIADEPAPPPPTPPHPAGSPAGSSEVALRAFRETTVTKLGLAPRPHSTGQPEAVDRRPDATTEPPAAYWPAFVDAVRTHAPPLDPAWLLDMLDGLDEDLHHQGYQTQDDLWRYCERVGSVPGMVSVAIWGLKPDLSVAGRAEAFDLARRRGRAFQLTNILRDISGDHATGRCYIPRDALDRHALTPDLLAAWQRPENCRRLVLEQAALAADEFRASHGLEEHLVLDCAPVLWTMSAIYRGILRLIERDPARSVVNAPARVATWQKIALALWGMTRSRMGWGAPDSPW